MKVLVIEDEKIAAERLIQLIEKCRPDYRVVKQIDAVEESVQWLNRNPAPDLIFLDIHLADGNSFEIFKNIEVSSPIIFTTAYDQYAVQAFKVNSVDYLLKPIDSDDLCTALDKFEKLQSVDSPSIPNLDKLVKTLSRNYKTRFVVKVGEHIQAIEVEHILYFFSEDKATYLQTDEGKRCLIDFPLDKVETMVDPERFVRINRKYLVSFSAIQDILSHSNSRLRLKLLHSDNSEVIVSRERVQEFKNWLDK